MPCPCTAQMDKLNIQKQLALGENHSFCFFGSHLAKSNVSVDTVSAEFQCEK